MWECIPPHTGVPHYLGMHTGVWVYPNRGDARKCGYTRYGGYTPKKSCKSIEPGPIHCREQTFINSGKFGAKAKCATPKELCIMSDGGGDHFKL